MKVQFSRPHPVEAALERVHAASPEPSPYLPVRPVRRIDRVDAAIAGLVLVLAATLYTVTLTRGLNSMSGDSSELITKSALFQVAHSPGSPLYVWLGKLFSLSPVGQLATRVNLMSAL